MNVKELTHSQQQPQAPKTHKKESTVRLTTRITMLCPPPPRSLLYTFKAPFCCFEDVSNTALTVVCTTNVSIDCNGFDVSNLPQKKNILK